MAQKHVIEFFQLGHIRSKCFLKTSFVIFYMITLETSLRGDEDLLIFELSFNSKVLARSWSPMISPWLVCIRYQ